MKTPTMTFYSSSRYEYINQEVYYLKFICINQFLFFFSSPFSNIVFSPQIVQVKYA